MWQFSTRCHFTNICVYILINLFPLKLVEIIILLSYVGSSRCRYYSREPSRPSALFYSLNSNNSKYLVVGIAVCDDKWDAKLMILNGPRNTMVYSLIIIICMYIPRRAFLGNSGCCVCIPRCCRCVYIYSLLWFQTLQFL